jgi:thiol-disulfide isomerase/thioredoxin
MKRKPHSRTKRTTTKSVVRLPDLEYAKSAVLNSLTSPDAQGGYRHAIDEFVDWYYSESRLAFNRIVVLRYRSHLESRQLAPGTINPRLGAVRRLAMDGLARSKQSRNMAMQDVPAPMFDSLDIQGKPQRLADYKGKVVLVNIWATWCEPCRKEMPQLDKLYESRKGRGFIVLGISDETVAKRT